jgi:hypothetical protein
MSDNPLVKAYADLRDGFLKQGKDYEEYAARCEQARRYAEEHMITPSDEQGARLEAFRKRLKDAAESEL